jgi:hypothetical protein
VAFVSREDREVAAGKRYPPHIPDPPPSPSPRPMAPPGHLAYWSKPKYRERATYVEEDLA